MPLCPACHTEQTRRINGVCPKCSTPIQVHRGAWYRANGNAPTITLLHHFEKRVSAWLSAHQLNRVLFSIPRKGARYKRELLTAERLLEAAEHDYDLAIAALDILFDDKRFNWKTRDTLLWVEKDFNTALALARANREALLEKKRREQEALSAVLTKENVF